MRELPLPIHLTIFERAFVFMALRPAVSALSIDDITTELANVLAPIREHSHTLTMSLVANPSTLVLCHHTIFVSLP